VIGQDLRCISAFIDDEAGDPVPRAVSRPGPSAQAVSVQQGGRVSMVPIGDEQGRLSQPTPDRLIRGDQPYSVTSSSTASRNAGVAEISSSRCVNRGSARSTVA
jgi:hypothetical protein